MEQNLETQEVVEQVTQNPFDSESWVTPTEQVLEQENVVVEEKKEEAKVVEQLPNQYLKENLGFEDWDSAKKEIEELRSLKEKSTDLKFANKDSEDYFNALKDGDEDKVYEILSKKQEIKRLNNLDISNNKDAAEIIKANLKFKYESLSDSEIQDMIDEQYSIPEKPIDDGSYLEEEYNRKVKDWEAKVDSINRKMIRDAKIAKPEVTKYLNNLTLPEIQSKNIQDAEVSQQELDNLNKQKELFLKTAESAINDFGGFKALVKDKDVEIPVSYELSKEEKSLVSKTIQSFAENGLNANAIFAERWLTKEGNLDTNRIVRDLSLLYNEERISQKYVNEAANKRLEDYLKSKKNITIDNQQRQSFVPDGKDGDEKTQMADFFFGQG